MDGAVEWILPDCQRASNCQPAGIRQPGTGRGMPPQHLRRRLCCDSVDRLLVDRTGGTEQGLQLTTTRSDVMQFPTTRVLG